MREPRRPTSREIALPQRGNLKRWLLFGGLALLALQLFAGATAALAHQGIQPGQNPWTAWNSNPFPTLLLLIAAYLYITGLQRWPNPTHPVRMWQRVSFFAGLLSIFIALQTPIDPISVHLFSVHQVQHLLTRMVAPLLILLGAPLTPTLRGLPPWARQGVVRPLVKNRAVRRIYNFLIHPAIAFLIFMGLMYVWLVPYLHNAAVRNDYLHEVMHFTMFFSGLLFWWVMIDPKPHRSKLHYGLRIVYVGLMVIPNTVLGAAITFHGSVLYESYAEVEPITAMSLLTDQQLGGLIIWVPAEMMSILAAAVIMVMWYQKEHAEEERDIAAFMEGRDVEGRDVEGRDVSAPGHG